MNIKSASDKTSIASRASEARGRAYNALAAYVAAYVAVSLLLYGNLGLFLLVVLALMIWVSE